MECSYCASKNLQPVLRRRGIETVWAEMVACVNDYGIHDFAFCDDALLVDAKMFFYPLLDRIIRERIDVRLHTPNGLHLKLLDAPLLAAMREAGFTTLRFGYESGLPKHRSKTDSKADLAVLESKLSLLQEYQFSDIGVYMMGGLPGGNPSEMAMEMRHVSSFGAAVKPVFISPVPGTPLFAEFAVNYPDLSSDILWHNDSFFVTQLSGWGGDEVETIRQYAKALNRGIGWEK
jgi:radical SAM superfamily enzyme YgiQ (UPF0313 family)